MAHWQIASYHYQQYTVFLKTIKHVMTDLEQIGDTCLVHSVQSI